jgi:hypothetical protein
MLELGEKLIKAGVLYADDTPVEQMREVCENPLPGELQCLICASHIILDCHYEVPTWAMWTI